MDTDTRTEPQVVAPTVPGVTVDGAKALATMIEQTYELLKVGMFQGVHTTKLIQVQAWLEQFHRTVLSQLPPEPVKPEVK